MLDNCQTLIHQLLEKAQDLDFGLISRNLVFVDDMCDDISDTARLLQVVPDGRADVIDAEIGTGLQFKNDGFIYQIRGELVRGRTQSIVLCDHPPNSTAQYAVRRTTRPRRTLRQATATTALQRLRAATLCLTRKDRPGDGKCPVPLAPRKNYA